VIMPGSGVRATNIKDLAERTGAVEFHSSLKTILNSGMHYQQPAFANSKESYTHPGIDREDVVQLRQALFIP
jgi:copper homeostasis protein